MPVAVRAHMPGGEIVPLEFVLLGQTADDDKWRWETAWELRAAPECIDFDDLPENVVIEVRVR